MKIELNNNKVYLENDGVKKEIHPFWLRERVNGDKFVDIKTKQRLFDPTQIQENITINDINLSKDFLEVTFNDGASTKLSIQEIIEEFSNNNFIKLIKKVEWDSSLNDFNIFTCLLFSGKKLSKRCSISEFNLANSSILLVLILFIDLIFLVRELVIPITLSECCL